MTLTGRLSPSWWLENLLRPLLIAVMLVCLAAPLVVVLEWLYTGWDGAYFSAFVFLAGLEGILSERVLQSRRIGGSSYLVSRGAEALILLLVLKFAAYIPLGLERLWADAQIWSSDPYQFLTGMDLLLFPLFLPLWVGAIHVGRVVRDLDAVEGRELPPEDRTSAAYYLWLTRPLPARHSQEVFDSLGEFFVWGGSILLLAVTAVHFLISSVHVLAIPTLIYFALGIALLSQGRFSMLYAGWQVQGVPVQRGIARRWLLWAAVFLVAVALVALLLPTRYAMGPIQALLGLFAILFSVLSFILFLILFLLSLPLAFLFPRQVETPIPPTLGAQPLIPGETPRGGMPPWLEVVASAIFWIVVLAIVGYALIRFLRDRLGSLSEEEGVARSPWSRILAWLRDLWRRWRTWRQEVQTRLDRRRSERKSERPGSGRVFRFFSPGRLSPRELVRYFYLSAARRAAEAGQSRRPGQTPYEYESTLDERFPDLEPDLSGLTDAFVRARYSPHPVQQHDADTVKPLWQRIKAVLRRRRAGL